MQRRDFIMLLGGAAAWPFTARAQQPGKLPTIGFLGVTPTAWKAWTAAFVERLRALGWIEGRTVAIEFRWSEGRSERYADIAAEFVRMKVDVIVTSGAAVPPLMQATSEIPIVFAVANDPVKSGLVASLAKPGGKVTGLSLVSSEVSSKRFELLREVAPGLRRLAIMADAGFPQAVLEMREVQAMARTLDIEVVTLEIRRAEDIAPAFEEHKAHADAVYVVINELLNASRARIVNLALGARLPSIYGTSDWVRSGGLISYGPNFPTLFARAADLTDRILRGTRPSDIPVEQPTKFELVINLNTAKALGLTLPPMLLARADEVIE
jgi:putative tryptophan/tyrosine transport system substrate-binding protein